MGDGLKSWVCEGWFLLSYNCFLPKGRERLQPYSFYTILCYYAVIFVCYVLFILLSRASVQYKSEKNSEMEKYFREAKAFCITKCTLSVFD